MSQAQTGAAGRLFLAQPWRAVREAERCLGCHEAPCIAACPTRINVPQFIGRLRTGNLAGAYATLQAANALPAICGLVCPGEYLCEGACLATRLSGRPLQIGALQYYTCQAAQPEVPAANQKATRVAVVGAGPAGLACAVHLRRLGYGVDLYDRHLRPGGLLSYSIPSDRLPDALVDEELGRILEAGIELHLGTALDAAGLGRLIERYPALFLGLGLSASLPLEVPGSELAGVWSALDYLAAVRRAGRGEGAPPQLGERVVVVGGGNVAVDAAAVALAGGAREVTVLYRRTVQELPAWADEYAHAARLGVQFRWLTVVREIEGQDGRVRAVRTQRMRLVERDASGRRGVQPLPGTESTLPCDAVIVAVGQALEARGLAALGLEVTPQGTLWVDADSGQTSRPGVFAGGDAVRGGSYVVQAVADGKRAALAIDSYLAGEDA